MDLGKLVVVAAVVAVIAYGAVLIYRYARHRRLDWPRTPLLLLCAVCALGGALATWLLTLQ
ncbi:hypothetical protein [Saccharopolyspora taberi]|uniref:Uncharacterized protein n=1 Tax=Saccharopolyspora taberi TaxID=60895 RepID=A0ABN3VAD3_9PSEU